MAVPIGLMMLLCAATPAEFVPHEAVAQSFLRTPGLATGGAELVHTSTRPRQVEGLDAVVFACLTDPRRQSHVAVDMAGVRVISYLAQPPEPPVPPGSTSPADRLTRAREFATGQVAGLLPAGDDLLLIDRRAITDRGAEELWFAAVRDGVRMPTEVMVGVRVTDGRIASYRLDCRPCKVAVRRQVTLTAAQAAVVAEPRLRGATPIWLDTYAEMHAGPAGWQCVWTLVFERAPTSKQPEEMGDLYRARVDARDGSVMGIDQLDLKSTLYGGLAAWYVRAGGRHRGPTTYLRPLPMFRDSRPEFSPDGQQLAFISTRSRAGYPSWLATASGVFVVGADGGVLRCVDPAPAHGVHWAPHGQALLLLRSKALERLDLRTGERQRWALPTADDERGGTSLLRAVETSAGKIVALVASQVGLQTALVIDATRPDAPLVWQALPPEPKHHRLAGPVIDRQGRVLLASNTLPTGLPKQPASGEPKNWGLFRIDPEHPELPPEKLCAGFASAVQLRPGWQGRLLLGSATQHFGAVDPETGQVERVLDNLSAEPDGANRQMAPDGFGDLIFAPDGRRFVFCHSLWSGVNGEPSAIVLWSGDLATRSLRPLVPVSADEVPVVAPGAAP